MFMQIRISNYCTFFLTVWLGLSRFDPTFGNQSQVQACGVMRHDATLHETFTMQPLLLVANCFRIFSSFLLVLTIYYFNCFFSCSMQIFLTSLGILQPNKHTLTILDNVSGIVKPGRSEQNAYIFLFCMSYLLLYSKNTIWLEDC